MIENQKLYYKTLKYSSLAHYSLIALIVSGVLAFITTIIFLINPSILENKIFLSVYFLPLIIYLAYNSFESTFRGKLHVFMFQNKMYGNQR